MKQASGLLTKISDNHYQLLTIEEEYFLEGNIGLSDGFYWDLDLSTAVVRKIASKRIEATEVFSSGIFQPSNEASDCTAGDDCSSPSDCDCDCAFP